MLCQKCKTNVATVHVSEIQVWHGAGSSENQIRVEHLCEPCGQQSDLPFAGSTPVLGSAVWQLIKVKAQGRQAPPPPLSCESCGLDLDDLRRHGRLGCEHCYEVFAEPLSEMLERMHGATEHIGRLPAAVAAEEDDDESAGPLDDRKLRLVQLRGELECAIAEEAYERAAGLRDELRELSADEEPS